MVPLIPRRAAWFSSLCVQINVLLIVYVCKLMYCVIPQESCIALIPCNCVSALKELLKLIKFIFFFV